MGSWARPAGWVARLVPRWGEVGDTMTHADVKRAVSSGPHLQGKGHPRAGTGIVPTATPLLRGRHDSAMMAVEGFSAHASRGGTRKGRLHAGRVTPSPQ